MGARDGGDRFPPGPACVNSWVSGAKRAKGEGDGHQGRVVPISWPRGALRQPLRQGDPMSLVPVHGGLDQLVDRVLTFNKKKALLSEAGSLPKIQVNDADLATMQRISDGTLRPLSRPMTQDAANQVLDTQTITSKGKKYAWTVPFSLPVTDEEAAKLKVGGQAALVDGSGNVVGALKVGSIFDWDKAKMVEKVYRTKRTDHPGAKIIV